MKNLLRIVSLALVFSMLLGIGTMLVSAAPGAVTGQDKVETQNIKLGNTDTGVSLTQMTLTSGSKYSLGTTGLVNVVEVTPSDKVALKVLNGGSYNWSKATMGASALAYNKAHDDSTVLAAVNGDPWLVYHTDYDGDGKKPTGESVKHGSVSRGLMIIDGELWASHQIDDENNLARDDNAERGTPAARGPVFAIKADGTAMIGTPTIGVTLVNATTDKNVRADGINRLPAPNSIILYNHRCGTESFAYADAYEIYLECADPAFSLKKATGGKVVAIYESGDTSERPAIDEKTVVISARGTSISRIKGQFKVGDTVGVTCSVRSDSDMPAQVPTWPEVEQAIGSFFYLLKNNIEAGQPGNATNYPCSIIGIKKDGTILMTSTTSIEDGTRSACQMQNLPKLCKELGYKTAILFDGGGSTEMISLTDGQYVRRTATVDGTNSVRSVINGIAVVYNGINEEPKNSETMFTYTYESLGIERPELPDLEGADLRGEPTSSYRYYADIATINGNKQEGLIGLRDASTKTLVPATVSGIAVDENNKIALSGYAFANGGQGNHYWSVDKDHWYLCTDGVFSNSDEDTVNIATGSAAAMTSAHAENAVFESLTADLSAYAGKTVTVYFGLSPKGAPDKVCHYLTISDVAVPIPGPEPWDENKNIVLHQSLDELRINGNANDGVFTPGKSSDWNKIAKVDTNDSTLAYWGWVALNAELGQFGYRIGDAEPVYDDRFACETEQGVLDAAAGVTGSTGASRMLINIDISALSGSNKVQALYKAPDGRVAILCEFEVIREEAPVETPTETEPVTKEDVTEKDTSDMTDAPVTDESAAETKPTTGTSSGETKPGCASAVFGGVGLVLLCGAAVVLGKRKD